MQTVSPPDSEATDFVGPPDGETARRPSGPYAVSLGQQLAGRQLRWKEPLLAGRRRVVIADVRAALPPNESERLRALERYQVLDTPKEEGFDRITRLIARVCDTPMAIVTLIDRDRQWFKSCLGLDGSGTEREVAFCAHAILSTEPMIVENALLDPRFSDNPFVVGAPYVRFYAGAPLINSDGFELGTLCIADTRPRQLSSSQLATLVDLSRMVVDELELRLKNRVLAAAEARLLESRMQLTDRVRVLEGILDSAGEGIVVVDEEHRFAVFNPAATRLVGEAPPLGTRPGQPRNYTLHVATTGEPFPPEQLPLARAMRGEQSDNVELVIRRPDVGDRLVRATGRPLKDDAGKLRGALVTFNDITALRAAEEELSRRAITDQLTGLPNRRAFDERLAILVAEGGRGRRFAHALGDIDHFKRVNDSFGHAAGDEVLVQVAHALHTHVRRTDFVARYGGEEFCILFTDVDGTLALRLADNLRRIVAEQKCAVPATISMGVCANRPNECTEPGLLVQCADRALYDAKRQGRNRVVAGQLSARESMPIWFGIKARAGERA
jgi:diguanylate cyclase (GGDEF)-like protein